MKQPEQILERDSRETELTEASAGWRSRIASYLELSTILRLAGGGFTVAAILIFLFQRWEDATDLYRYGMIFGETLTLAVLGFVTSYWLKDQRSTRVFLGLSLVSTSAVFTILAAMIFSQVQWLPAEANLPDYAFWVMDAKANLLLLLAGSFVLLGAQSMFTLSVLARPAARGLGLLLLLNTVLLLLPVRDMGITTLLVLPALFQGFRYLATLRKTTPAMKTGEGTMAGLLVMLPLAIMIGRGASLYAQGPVAIGSLALLAYLLLRQIALSITQGVQFRKVLEVSSLLPAVVASLQVVALVDINLPLLNHWLIAVFGVAISGFLVDLSRRAIAGRQRYLQAVLAMGLLVSFSEQLFFPGMVSAIFGLTVSAVVLLFSIAASESNLSRLSLLTIAGSLLHLVSRFMFNFNAGTWISMTILGMATIILAAAVDRYGKRMMGMMQKLNQG